MDQTPRTSSRYLPGLDGLRAVAILGIVLYHMFPDTVRGGYLGVTVFFVLSGYLLSRTGRASLDRNAYSAASFYQRRLRRIYPALLWVIALTLIALRVWLPAGLTGVRQELLSVVLGYQNWQQILQNQDYFSRITSTTPFTHMWSLAVELQFYLVWPLLFGLYRLERREGDVWGTVGIFALLAAASVVTMGLIYYYTGDAARVYYGTDTRVHALLLGGALGLMPEGERRISKGLGAALFTLCALGLLAMMALLDGAWDGTYYGLLALSAVLSGVLIMLCAREELPFDRLLGWKPLAWLGQRSYEIYLVMYPVLYFLERLRPVEDAALLHGLEGAVILVLACLIHALTVPKAWLAPEGEPGWKCLRRPALWAMAGLTAAGIVIAAAAPGSAGDLQELQQALEQNRQQLEQAAAPEETAAPEEDAVPEETPMVDPADVSMIGDSVMLGALPALQEALPGCVVDAKVSRQMWDAYGVIDTLEANGQLGGTVIIALGTNGPFAESEGQGIIDRLGPDRQIYWVTAFGTSLAWQEQSNSSIRALAEHNANVTLIDWAALASEHWDWLYSDGIHLQSAGQAAYAQLIADALGYVPPPPTEDPNAPLLVWDDSQGILISDP